MTPEYLEILMLRELRKAGFELGQPRVHRRAELPEPEHGFVLELVIPLSCAGATRRALVVCRRQDGIVGQDVVASAKARLPDAGAAVAMIFTTSDFAADAVAAAHEGGVALLRVVDSKAVFAPTDHYPSWLPAHMAQVVDGDVLDAIRSGADG